MSKLRANLTTLGMSADESAPFLSRLVGLSAGTEPIAHLSALALQERSLEIFRAVVLASSRARPLVIAVEDLHWLDRTSEQYMVGLVDALVEAPIFLVTTYRTGYRPPWRDRSYVTDLRLQPLARADARHVLDGALDRDSSRMRLAGATAEAILDRADGNPFFIEELARALGMMTCS